MPLFCRQPSVRVFGTEYSGSIYSPVQAFPLSAPASRRCLDRDRSLQRRAGARAQQIAWSVATIPATRSGACIKRRPTPWAGVTVSVVDEYGQPLPSLSPVNHILVVGTAGQRYAIQVDKLRPSVASELVASVDGQMSSMASPPASANRGYVVIPYRRVSHRRLSQKAWRGRIVPLWLGSGTRMPRTSGLAIATSVSSASHCLASAACRFRMSRS